MQGQRHTFEDWGVNALEGGVVNTVKTLKFEKLGGALCDPLLIVTLA